MSPMKRKHDWRLHNDGQEFFCMKCSKVFKRTRDEVFPSDAGCSPESKKMIRSRIKS